MAVPFRRHRRRLHLRPADRFAEARLLNARSAEARLLRCGAHFLPGAVAQGPTLVDPHTMPGWLHAFVDVNPVSHLVTAVRGLMAGAPDAGEIAWVVVGCAALTAVCAPSTMRLYGTRR